MADIEWEEVKVRKTDESGWLFSAKFSKPDAKFIFASGAGRNEFKVFDNSENNNYRSVASLEGFGSPITSIDHSPTANKLILGQ